MQGTELKILTFVEPIQRRIRICDTGATTIQRLSPSFNAYCRSASLPLCLFAALPHCPIVLGALAPQ
jgi:hypothetical protein